MLSEKELGILDQYHKTLESVNELTTIIHAKDFVWEDSSVELRVKLSVENNALSKINEESIVKKFKDWEETVKQYLEERLTQTGNSLLKAKYYHFLYCFSRGNKHIINAIESYKQTLAQFLNNLAEGDRHVTFKEILDVVIQLTKKLNYKKNDLKDQIHGYLRNPKIYDRMKTWIIMSVIECKLFKIEELTYIPDLLRTLAERETAFRFIEINLELGLKVAIKLNDEIKVKLFNELLGDNEYKNLRIYSGEPESMMVPHLNNSVYLKIIKYYKRSGNKNKAEAALLAHTANKKNAKFLKIKGTINRNLNTELIEREIRSISGLPTKNMLFHLIWGDILPLLTNEHLENFAEQQKGRITDELMSVSVQDINNNGKGVVGSEHLKFQLYDKSVEFTAVFVIDIVLNAMNRKNLSYSKALKILNSSSYFGETITITRQGTDITYTWFEMIKSGVKTFFDQCNIILKNKQPDWRISTDLLAIKFEGILRDMIQLAGGVTTKVDANGNTSEILLEELLRHSKTDDLFDKNDINLFQYVLTGKGYNIRNHVAHSFYKPQDYSMQNAVMVLLCLFRLAKFRYIITKNSVPKA